MRIRIYACVYVGICVNEGSNMCMFVCVWLVYSCVIVI